MFVRNDSFDLRSVEMKNVMCAHVRRMLNTVVLENGKHHKIVNIQYTSRTPTTETRNFAGIRVRFDPARGRIVRSLLLF